MKEIWKSIKEFENLYEISNFGRVKSLAREWITGKNLKRKHEDMILKLAKDTYGYLFVRLCKNGKYKTFKVHQLVAKYFVLNPENKPEPNHLDGNKQNNRWDNLEWATKSENMKHAYKLGLKNEYGEKNPQSKLTNDDIILIRKLWNEYHIKQRTIANLFNTCYQNISLIVNRKNWSHI